MEDASGIIGELVIANRILAREGVVDAFVNALEVLTCNRIVVVEYSEHTLGQSADAEAVCYVQLNVDGARPCGVGRSHDIVQASLAAIISALDAQGLDFANAA